MTVSNAAYLKTFYTGMQNMGNKIISSDAMFEIIGYEEMALLIKQFPDPVLTSQGEIEVSTPMGGVMYQPQQLKVAHQGSIALTETMKGHISDLNKSINLDGGIFSAWIYEGTPQTYLRRKKILNAFFQLDDADRNWEDRSQILTFTGTVFFNYFGEEEAGNSKDYRAGGKASLAIGSGVTPKSGYQMPSELVQPPHPHSYQGV